MALKQKPAWDVSSSGIMNGVFQVPLKLAAPKSMQDFETFPSGRSWQRSPSIFMDHRPVFTHCVLAPARTGCLPISCQLPANRHYEQGSIAGQNHDFPGGTGAARILVLVRESHAGHAFAILRPDQVSRRFARRHARRPCPLEVVAAEPASDIDRLADEI